MAHQTLTPLPETVSVEVLPASRKAFVIVASVVVGLAIAVLWSAQLVDDQIGENVASGVLGRDASTGAVSAGMAGGVFAFVAGLAGTFTACNIAAFSAVGTMIGEESSAGSRVRAAIRQIGWLAVGVIVTAGLYGAVGAAIGTRIPQFDTNTVGHGVPIRLLQSLIVFVVIGAIFLWMGLAAINVVPDPLGRIVTRRPNARLVFMGVLIGGFLIGRPYPLFFKLFQEAARTHNVFYGAGTFVLTAIGNILVMAVLFVILAAAMGGRYQRWLAQRSGRVATITAAALIVGGAFLIFYWGVRLPANFAYGWFPHMPWS